MVSDFNLFILPTVADHYHMLRTQRKQIEVYLQQYTGPAHTRAAIEGRLHAAIDRENSAWAIIRSISDTIRVQKHAAFEKLYSLYMDMGKIPQTLQEYKQWKQTQ